MGLLDDESSFLETLSSSCSLTWNEAEGVHRVGFHNPLSAPLEMPRCVPDQKATPQPRASGQVSRPLAQED